MYISWEYPVVQKKKLYPGQTNLSKGLNDDRLKGKLEYWQIKNIDLHTAARGFHLSQITFQPTSVREIYQAEPQLFETNKNYVTLMFALYEHMQWYCLAK